MGEEVRQVMREQALHEKQYSEYIMEQAQLSGIYNKEKQNEIQEKIKVCESIGMLTQTQGEHQKLVQTPQGKPRLCRQHRKNQK